MLTAQLMVTYLDDDGKPVKTSVFVGKYIGDPKMQFVEVDVLPLDTYNERLNAAYIEAEAAYEA